jgi:hypothetical protein
MTPTNRLITHGWGGTYKHTKRVMPRSTSSTSITMSARTARSADSHHRAEFHAPATASPQPESQCPTRCFGQPNSHSMTSTLRTSWHEPHETTQLTRP